MLDEAGRVQFGELAPSRQGTCVEEMCHSAALLGQETPQYLALGLERPRYGDVRVRTRQPTPEVRQPPEAKTMSSDRDVHDDEVLR